MRPDILLGCRLASRDVLPGRRRAGGPKHRPKALALHVGSHVARGRRLIEDTFGIPVISKYSAMETSQGRRSSASERAGFHLHEDLCQLTIVDREGKLLADGEPGEIVLSNLVNRGSVLLNYRIGDLGRISTSTVQLRPDDAACWPISRGEPAST